MSVKAVTGWDNVGTAAPAGWRAIIGPIYSVTHDDVMIKGFSSGKPGWRGFAKHERP